MRHALNGGRRGWVAVCLLASAGLNVAGWSGLSAVAEEASAGVASAPYWAPAEAQAVMGIDEVKVGMKGYGLTVFHGDDIEPFPVVAVSVVTNSDPKRTVIWVSCPDERMQRTGPVQGMSGSPIYLWEEGEEGVIGEGGRLIGAFAFGFADTNECLVGVQPIEYMRETGDRASVGDPAGRQAGLRVRPGAAAAMMSGLERQVEQAAGPWRSGTVAASAELLRRTPWGQQRVERRVPTWSRDTPSEAGMVRLGLPVNVGSAELAEVLRPMMSASGLVPYAGGGGSAGTMSADGGLSSDALLPSNVKTEDVELVPGSVLAVPLAFGDYVPAAAGTVTDVLPDGTVLGFGHAMDGVGDTALPMATGYTHYIVSRRSISFKWTGVLEMRGSLLQDESAAVAGTAVDAFTTSPMTVDVSMPEQPDRSYAYELVNHPSYTPSIAVMMPIVSMLAVQNPPAENTMRVTGEYRFDNGRSLPVDTLIPFGSPQALAFELAPVLGTLLQNEFSPVELTGGDFDIEIVEGVSLTFIETMSASPSVVRPGDVVTVRVVTRAYDGPAESHTTTFTVPMDTPEGELPIVASSADEFVMYDLMTDPKYAVIESADELFDAYSALLTPERESLHVAMLQPDRARSGRTVGNATLANLPSHVAALLDNPSRTEAVEASPFVPKLRQQIPVGRVVAGEQSVLVQVVRDDR